MKKIMLVIVALLFSLAMTLPSVASDKKGRNRDYRQSDQDRGIQMVRKGDRGRGHYRDYDYYDRSRDRYYEYRNPKYRPQGYRRQPYDRYYDHPYWHRKHEYHYEGHWNSWNDWERYRRRQPDRFHHGRYYREGGHLFFRFCEPMGVCFFFSIGR